MGGISTGVSRLAQVGSHQVDQPVGGRRLLGRRFAAIPVQDVRANLLLDQLCHQAIHGAPAGCDRLQNRGTFRAVFQRLLNCVHLPTQATDAVQQLLFVSDGVRHSGNIPDQGMSCHQAARRARTTLARAFLLAAVLGPWSARALLVPLPPDDSPTVLPHSTESPAWVSGQANVIFEWHPEFRAKYSGPNSLRAESENATSYVVTLFTGYQLTETTEVHVDIESTGGSGLSTALGLAGFTNLDVVRNPQLSAEPYIARAQLRQVIPLSDDHIQVARGPLSLATSLPVRRMEVRAGKMSVVDFFDVNQAGSDSHTQFMNWTIDNNGAYDYAADTRGYTYGLMVEYDDRAGAVRFAEALMPKVANGIDLDWNIARARGENLELELHRELIPDRETVVRLLAYVNHADMGNYREANQAFLTALDPTPDITAHRHQGNVKYGFGVNIEQPLTDDLMAFGRWGWNEGQHESFAYTEVNASGVIGAALRGDRWRRPGDKFGIAGVVNAISAAHRQYLALGGQGFLLGDGALNYGTEQILEGYYTVHLWRGVSVAADLQYIRHPGYNRDRGPVIVPGFRFHTDF
jgi:high affinity Mn2+ porin